MDGIKSCFSILEIRARLIPVASARDCCVMDFSFLLLVTRSARITDDNFLMKSPPCMLFKITISAKQSDKSISQDENKSNIG